MRDLDTIIAHNAQHQAKHLTDRIKLVRELKPEGFTIDLYGNLQVRDHGYCVGKFPVQEEYLERQVSILFESDLQDNIYVGGWTDENTGKFYLDWVDIIEDLYQAVRIAETYKQQAVYDFKNKDVIFI